LTKISAKFVDSEFIKNIKKESTKNIVDIFNSIKDEKVAKAAVQSNKKVLNVVGVTTCITGVAHTFMAAQALEEEGQKRG